MLKNEIIELQITNKNRSAYEFLLNNKLSYKEIIRVPSNLILKGSHVAITAICDYCYSEKKISNKDYNKQTSGGKLKFACCKKCSIEKTKETNLVKIGVENQFQSEKIKIQIKNTNIKKYGVDNPNKSPEIVNKRKNTNIKKYGHDSASSSVEVKEKVKISNLKRFGVEYPSQNIEIIEKMKNTCFEKWGTYNFSKTDMFKSKLRDKWFEKMYIKLQHSGILKKIEGDEYTIKCNLCGIDFKILSSIRNKRILNGDCICSNCNPLKQNVKQNEISDFIKHFIESVEINNRQILDGLEIDIYLPDLKLAFEFNGLYWHSEIYKKPNYHKMKSGLCESMGIQLFHIWEDDWQYKQEIVKSMILNKLGKTPNKIGARKCEIREITDNRLVRLFLNNNHIQGFVGSKIKLGLFYQDELVSLMTFGNLRKSLGNHSKEGSYEMLRFCNKLNISVIGGASKLFKYFLKNYNVSEVISYSDSSRGQGNLYKQLGFNLSHESDPNYYWVIDGIRHHRFNFRKDKLIRGGADPNKTEIQIMTEKGYYRVFDCGNKKWIYSK